MANNRIQAAAIPALIAFALLAPFSPRPDATRVEATGPATPTTTTVASFPSLAAALNITKDTDLAETIAEIQTDLGPVPIVQWVNGYRAANGPEHLVDIFVNDIIPCESRTEGFPDGNPNAIGPLPMTDNREWDFGFAQINRSAHHDNYETIFGANTFETTILDPWHNGYYTGIIAEQSGTQPWYKSRSCHGQ